eukprot:m.139823 g.139823  ORF g.139823 m.139823 type:complete len:647 (-) comp10002_c0_seq1:152-2092(-)
MSLSDTSFGETGAAEPQRISSPEMLSPQPSSRSLLRRRLNGGTSDFRLVTGDGTVDWSRPTVRIVDPAAPRSSLASLESIIANEGTAAASSTTNSPRPSIWSRISSRNNKVAPASGPSPSSSPLPVPKISVEPPPMLRRQKTVVFERRIEKQQKESLKRQCILDPSGDFHRYWLAVVTVAVLYNCWIIIFRVAFSETDERPAAFKAFLCLDYLCDFIYIADIYMQTRTAFRDNGDLIIDPLRMRQHYFESRPFLDFFSVIPWELLLLGTGYHVALRFNRVFKVHRWLYFETKLSNRTDSPNVWRFCLLLQKMVLAMHIDACLYYMMSAHEGFGTNEWVQPAPEASPDTCADCVDAAFSSQLHRYLHAFFFASMTLTTIGDMPRPQTSLEYFFAIVNIMIGILMVATLVGNIAMIVSNINYYSTDFQKTMDVTKAYMKKRRIDPATQDEVKRWFDYNWERYRTVDEQKMLDYMPDKLRSDLTFFSHVDVLRRVKIFKDCSEFVLRELALSLRQCTYFPGEYICYKDDYGLEMFIISDGIVEVTSQAEDSHMVIHATLEKGQYFGEVALLGTHANSRRVADVRSRGFSELYSLSHEALVRIMDMYPGLRQQLEAEVETFEEFLDAERTPEPPMTHPVVTFHPRRQSSG